MQRRSRSFCSTTVDTMKKIWPRNMDPTKIAEITGKYTSKPRISYTPSVAIQRSWARGSTKQQQ